MVMNHYKRPKDFYVRTGLVHDREAHLGAAAGDRQLLAAAERHVLRRAGRRQEGLELRGQERLGRALQRADDDGLVAPPRRREVPGAPEPHMQAAAVQGAGLQRPRTTPYNRTIRPILHEPGPIGTGAYASHKGIPITKGEVLGASPSTTTTTCMWPRWASGPPGSSRTTPSRSAARSRTTSSRSTSPSATTTRRTTT